MKRLRMTTLEADYLDNLTGRRTRVPAATITFDYSKDIVVVDVKTKAIRFNMVVQTRDVVAAWCMDRDMRRASDDSFNQEVGSWMHKWLPDVEDCVNDIYDDLRRYHE